VLDEFNGRFGRTTEASQIEPRQAFRIEEAVNLDNPAARNRRPHHGEGPPLGYDDNPRGAINERRNFDCGGLRLHGERTTAHAAVPRHLIAPPRRDPTPPQARRNRRGDSVLSP
jgi:hypothetical protein